MTSEPLNIIYVVCHDTGRELGCYGRRILTPRLDAFASEGIRLDNMFCSSPACAPSRSCAYSGLPAHLNGQLGVTPSGCTLSPHLPTVVDYLNMGGYETVHIGFQHERYRAIENRYRVEKGGGKLCLVENGVDAAIGYLQARKPSDKPFYLNLATAENHAGIWQEQGNNRHAFYGTIPAEKVDYPTWYPEYEPLRRETGNFHACIQYFDSQMGRLLDAIDALGYLRNTLVIITTDHGPSGGRGKGTLYDHGTEIFFLARLPGVISPGQVSDALLQNLDLAPTLLDAAGLSVPGTMHGKSFWPLMRGTSYTPHESIVMERNFHGKDSADIMRAVRTKEHLYIRNFSPNAKHVWTKGRVPSAPSRIRRLVHRHVAAANVAAGTGGAFFRARRPRPAAQLDPPGRRAKDAPGFECRFGRLYETHRRSSAAWTGLQRGDLGKGRGARRQISRGTFSAV